MRTADGADHRLRAATSRNGDQLVFPIIDDLATLTWLVNLAALELHVHQWTVDEERASRANPDRLVIDLDPGEPARAARVLPGGAAGARPAGARTDLDACPVTSGSKGLHLYADLPGRRTPTRCATGRKEIAEELQAEHPKLVLSQMTKARRSGKVFLDWSQNAGSKTTISPYSLRGREPPMVATPRTWDEVEAGADDPLALDHLRFEEVLERVEEHGDLFRP